MKVKGYMVEVTYEDGVLRAHARNKMARLAMAGEPDLSVVEEATEAEPEEIPVPTAEPPRDEPAQAQPEQESLKPPQFLAGPPDTESPEPTSPPPIPTLKPWLKEALTDDLVLRKDEIAGVELKHATLLTNGRMTITSTSGKHHVLHFRRKQSAGFQVLAEALRA